MKRRFSKIEIWFLVGIIMMIAGISLSLIGLVRQTPSAAVAEEMSPLDISYQSAAVVTVGNRSYIPIPRQKGKSRYVRRKGLPRDILKFIDAFEQDHQELNVTSWKLLIDVSGTIAYTAVVGIFIDHQPRQEQE